MAKCTCNLPEELLKKLSKLGNKMDEVSEKYHPENVMNLLCNTTTYILGQTDEIDHDAGYGLVNYARARNAYSNSVNFTLTNYTVANG